MEKETLSDYNPRTVEAFNNALYNADKKLYVRPKVDNRVLQYLTDCLLDPKNRKERLEEIVFESDDSTLNDDSIDNLIKLLTFYNSVKRVEFSNSEITEDGFVKLISSLEQELYLSCGSPLIEDEDILIEKENVKRLAKKIKNECFDAANSSLIIGKNPLVI
ncbi:MAG: hypothetical protein FJ368_02730 [Pelagibacterales bacterium]|nr:hypothetical protein [Pelagibacterales bacterium]